jgi:hypothetical protein
VGLLLFLPSIFPEKLAGELTARPGIAIFKWLFDEGQFERAAVKARCR